MAICARGVPLMTIATDIVRHGKKPELAW